MTPSIPWTLLWSGRSTAIASASPCWSCNRRFVNSLTSRMMTRARRAGLRQYWKSQRPASPTRLLFVPHNGRAPLHETTLQKTFTAARADTRIEKHASIHTLRHSYATHLLESGVSLRTIQMVLGHKSMRTTEVYMHVTQPGIEHLQEILDRLMANLF